jgi:hypothetical protein
MARRLTSVKHCLQTFGLWLYYIQLLSTLTSIYVQISSLDDVKSVTNTDTNALRSIALDHLGVIGAKLKSSILRYKKTGDTESSGVGLKPLDEVISSYFHPFDETEACRILSDRE